MMFAAGLGIPVFAALNAGLGQQLGGPVAATAVTFAIGFVIVAGGYAAGWISGGAFNPAVAIGLDVASAGPLPPRLGCVAGGLRCALGGRILWPSSAIFENLAVEPCPGRRGN